MSQQPENRQMYQVKSPKEAAAIQKSPSKTYYHKLGNIKNDKHFRMVGAVEPQIQGKCGKCSCCEFFSSKLRTQKQKMNKIKKYISDINIETQGISEETELLSANFSYILELVSENIKREFQKQLPVILLQKQNCLKDLHSSIEKLSSTEKELKAKVGKLNLQVADLKKDNQRLKEELAHRSLSNCQSGCQSYSLGIQNSGQKNAASLSAEGGCRVFKVKKKFTQQLQKQSYDISTGSEKEEFNSLRSRIAKLKTKLEIQE